MEKDLPLWPRYDKEQKVIHLDSSITVTPDTTRPQFEFLVTNEAQPTSRKALQLTVITNKPKASVIQTHFGGCISGNSCDEGARK